MANEEMMRARYKFEFRKGNMVDMINNRFSHYNHTCTKGDNENEYKFYKDNQNNASNFGEILDKLVQPQLPLIV